MGDASPPLGTGGDATRDTHWSSAPGTPILFDVRYFARFNPLRAVRDLRYFLAQRQPYELWFGILAILFTGVILIAFLKDSRIERPYKPNIIYVQQWRSDRTDAEIAAKQKVDQVAVDARAAELERRQKDRQAQFKRLDDKLKAYGL